VEFRQNIMASETKQNFTNFINIKKGIFYLLKYNIYYVPVKLILLLSNFAKSSVNNIFISPFFPRNVFFWGNLEAVSNTGLSAHEKRRSSGTVNHD
jgi:hypothetical protein